MSRRIKVKTKSFYNFETDVHLVGILFNIIIADARNHEHEMQFTFTFTFTSIYFNPPSPTTKTERYTRHSCISQHEKVDWLAGCETKQTLLLVLRTLFS
jgi:hypothetical protein